MNRDFNPAIAPTGSSSRSSSDQLRDEGAPLSEVEVLRVMFDQIPIGIMLWDSRHRLRSANLTAARQLGYSTVKDLLRTPPNKMTVPFEILDENLSPLPSDRFPTKRALDGETMADATICYRARGSGDEFWAFVQSRPIELGATRERHVLTTMRDVTAVKESEITLRFLAETTATLFTSLDYEETIERIADAIVPRLADWCMVHLVGEQPGDLSTFVVAHRDPEKVAWARELRERLPFDSDNPSGVAHVLRTGQTVFIPHVTQDLLQASARNVDQRNALMALNPRSVIIAPMISRDQVVGALTLIRSEESPEYSLETVAFVEDLATRCAAAIDNSKLYLVATASRQRAERQAQRLRELTTASLIINNETSLPGVLQAIADQAARVSGSDVAIATIPTVDDPGELLHAVSRSDRFEMSEFDLNAGFISQRESPLYLSTVVRRTGPGAWNVAGLERLRYLGELMPLHSLLAVPLDDPDGRRGGLILVATLDERAYSDDDEQILRQLALVASVAVDNVRLLEQAQTAIQLRDQFLSMAAHELKTPMTTVDGYVQLLGRLLEREDVNLADVRKSAVAVQQQVGRLQNLLTDLLDASRIQHHRVVINPRRTNLCQIVEQVAERFEHAVERRDHHLIHVEAPEKLVGTWDSDRLDQVLTNLVSNALKYSPDGGFVRIVVRDEGANAVIEVSDQGIGISEKDRERLFEPFSRSESARRTAEGTGLGLYIAKQMIEQHGGSITVSSEEGNGSTFAVTLPRNVGARIVGWGES